MAPCFLPDQDDNEKFCVDHTHNFPARFDSNWTSKSEEITMKDDGQTINGHKMMARTQMVLPLVMRDQNW